jgi:hypothetical protein
MTLDDRLADFSVAKDYPALAYEETKKVHKLAILSDLNNILEDNEVPVTPNEMALEIIRNQLRQELRERVRKYCE